MTRQVVVLPAGKPDRTYSMQLLPHNADVCVWSCIGQVRCMQYSYASQPEYSYGATLTAGPLQQQHWEWGW